MISVYLLKTDAYNMVVITDGEIAKLYDCVPDGMFNGIDIYSPLALLQISCYFCHSEFNGELSGDISDYTGSDEIPFFDIVDSSDLILICQWDCDDDLVCAEGLEYDEK